MPRVASATLCADQYLMMLADREQIASLTWQSQSPLFHFAEAAEGIPQNRGSAEEFLHQEVSLVLTDQGSAPGLKQLSARLDLEVIELPFTTDLAAIEETVLQVAEALGQAERGRALVAEMQARRARLAEAVAGTPRPLAAYYRHDGGGAGAGTFVESVFVAAGFRNLQSELGQVGYQSLTLERAVTMPPDVFVTSFFDTAPNSMRTTFSYNPVLWRLLEERPMIEVPGSLWTCAGPLLLDAAELLHEARGELFPDLREGS